MLKSNKKLKKALYYGANGVCFALALSSCVCLYSSFSLEDKLDKAYTELNSNQAFIDYIYNKHLEFATEYKQGELSSKELTKKLDYLHSDDYVKDISEDELNIDEIEKYRQVDSDLTKYQIASFVQGGMSILGFFGAKYLGVFSEYDDKSM
ncbi:MAG: hypothetical protein IJW59_03375 [Clostridia bacterium]|nr:hypothetical protein [Clostridia bacterium]